ncbi:protein terminal ear1 [Euphorbia lathyris]|uniref:protein terminal ear1 n=1 Tax=Euphorbia lathyris TaxID=212925 RepID=UPI0033138189
MASSQKKLLNPNAKPYTIFPHCRITRKTIPYQVITMPFHPNWGFTYLATPLYLNNFYIQPDFVPFGKGFNEKKTERVFEEVEVDAEIVEVSPNGSRKALKKTKVKHQAPRFRCNGEKLGSWVKRGGTKLIKSEVEDNFFNGKTSLMIRNIPNQFQRQNLLQVLDRHCLEENKKEKVKSAYDFLYLPMDFRTGGNFGYAFVNFTNNVGASRFYKAFNDHQWDVPVNKKTCKICFAKLQGKAALTNHFKNSVFNCKTSEYLPVVFSPPRGSGSLSSKVIVIGRRKETTNSESTNA